MFLRFLLATILVLALVNLTVQFTLDKRGAAWFLRPNWKPPTKRFFYPEVPSGAMAISPTDFDQYIIY